MASPDHKAGLAVVVPISDNRSPTQRKFKQHALNVPRNRFSQSNGNTPPRPTNMGTTPRQPTTLPPARQPNGAPSRQQSTGVASLQPSNGKFPTQSRLLSVDEALQFSPFSSIVPFSPGEGYWSSLAAVSDSFRYHTNAKRQSPWSSIDLYYLE